MSGLKVVRNLLKSLSLWLPVLCTQAADRECSSSSFDQFWPSVIKVYEAEVHVKHKIPGNDFVFIEDSASVNRRKEQSFNHFENFLDEFPVFCKLKAMKNTLLNRQLFAVLIHELGRLEYALRNNKISAEYLVRVAFLDPHFITNLIGHVRQQSGLLSTMEVMDEHLPYFKRIATALRYKPHSELEYYQAFGNLLELINAGKDKKELEAFTTSIENSQEGYVSQSVNNILWALFGIGLSIGYLCNT